MAFFEAVRLALQTIRAQKLKSAFSIIGVFIGVMFLIAVVSVVQGMNRYMTDKFAGTILGVNTFRLRQFPDVQLGNVTDSTWRVWRRRPRVSYEDAQAVMRGVTVPVLAAWESSTRTTLVAGRKQAKDVAVTAATELYFDIRALPVEQGRPFTGQEGPLAAGDARGDGASRGDHAQPAPPATARAERFRAGNRGRGARFLGQDQPRAVRRPPGPRGHLARRGWDRHHEHHADGGGRADPRDRHPQVAGRPATRHSATVPGRGHDARRGGGRRRRRPGHP